jgi:lipoic acid synthetase
VELLRVVRDTDAGMVTKSGIMVGVGETREEVIELMRHLAEAGCMVLTIGQYLRPTGAHYPVARFISPTEFEELERLGAEAGIRVVVAGPLVRSSYRASQIYQDLMTAQ